MRRSLAPSVRAKPTETTPKTHHAHKHAGDLVVRAPVCSLYHEDDLPDSMANKLTAHFRLPRQDESKVRMFDPSRRNKTLGGRKSSHTPARAEPRAFLPPATKPIEEEVYTFEPLELWAPPPPEPVEELSEPEDADAAADTTTPSTKPPSPPPPPIAMEGFLCRWLRPHQREGVQFLFDCCMGLRDFDGAGCILADDMGLGKTLQSIAILWTLMRQGFDGSPAVRHAIVVCPVSLVTNWESEICKKWIKEERLRAAGIDVIAVAEASKDEVRKMVRRFTLSRSAILILSYETFRLHQRLFDKGNQCGLLICDEAHRLKNKETQTAVALTALATRRRILLSGTPIQNDLHEFYSMVHFANPGLLGSERDFHREYQSPILRGREPDATEKDVACGAAKSSQLGLIVNQFILRRTNQLLSKHLPPKIVSVVCCSMTSLQLAMYRQFLNSKVARQALNGGKQSMVLESINSLRKLVNHPMLVVSNGQAAKGFEDCIDMLPAEETGGASSSRRGNRPGRTPFRAEYSGKMSVLVQLLRHVRATTNDRVVLVSNYTQTLDLFELMCAAEGWASCKLDGSCSIKKRTKMVDDINDRHSSLFAFLLSSKAGGCGLNLVGANRLVLFDPDWNPANDKQAAARVWRDGQKKRVYIYRMLAAACIEEKVFERQLSKEGLSGIATNEEVEASSFSSKDLRDLFTLHEGCDSHLYERIKSLVPDEAAAAAAQEADPAPADFVPGGDDPMHRQVGCPKESGDMHLWAHHASAASVDDESLRAAALAAPKKEGGVSFVFSLHVKGMDLEAARKADEAAAAAEAASAAEAAEEAAKAKAARGTTEDKENRMLATARATASAMAALQALKGGRSGKTEPLQAHGRSAASSAAAAKRGAGAKAPAAKIRRKGYGSSDESEASDESSAESEEEEEFEASEEEASAAESEESEPEEGEDNMQPHRAEGDAVDDMAVEPSDAKASAELTKGRACGPGMARRRPRSAVISSMSEEEQVALAIRTSLTDVSPPPADAPAPRPAAQASMPPAARTMPAEVPDARDPAAGDSAGSSLSSVISLNETGWTAPPASSGSKIRRLSLGNKVRMTQA